MSRRESPGSLFMGWLAVCALMGFYPGLVAGFILGAIWGLEDGSWSSFAFGAVVGYIGASLVIGTIISAVNLMDGDGSSLGSLDNPHEFGSTEWYRHENERKKYFDH